MPAHGGTKSFMEAKCSYNEYQENPLSLSAVTNHNSFFGEVSAQRISEHV